MSGSIWLAFLTSLLGHHILVTNASATFTSLVHLVDSIEAEKEIIPYLESIVQAERKRLDDIERYAYY